MIILLLPGLAVYESGKSVPKAQMDVISKDNWQSGELPFLECSV